MPGLLLAAVMLAGPTALAQQAVTLVPYTSKTQGFTSVVPEGWTEAGPGIRPRRCP